MESKVTSAADIQLPEELVELVVLKKRDGSPVVVKCERIDELTMFKLLKGLPGLSIQEGIPVEKSDEEKVEEVYKVCAMLVEHGTALVNDAGEEVRPAFWSSAPIPGSVPYKLLSVKDAALIYNSIMRLSGYAEGVVDEASFPGGDGRGDGGGVGAVAAVEGDGQDAVGDAPRPE